MKTSIAFFAFAALAASGRADLVGLSSNYFGSTPGGLYNFDVSTGEAARQLDVTSPESGSSVLPTSIVGLAYLDGTLYASDVFGQGVFGKINATTGVYTSVNVNLPGGINYWTLAANPTSHVLYTTDGGGNDDPTSPDYSSFHGDLLVVDPVAGTTLDVGKTHDSNSNPLFMDAMAYDSNHSVLYGWNSGGLYSVNTANGLASLVAQGSNGIDNGGDMTYDASNDTLYAIENNNLFTVDRSTAALNSIGMNSASQNIDGLAIGPAAVPEPASLAALGLGAVALLRRRTRRS